MSFLAKRDVIASIKPRTQSLRGAKYITYEAYFGVNPISRKPVRKYAKSMSRLKEIINAFYDTLENCGAAAATLTPAQASDARKALAAIAEANLDLTLSECVDMVLRGAVLNKEAESQKAIVLIGEAYERYVEAVQNKSETYRKDIRLRVGAWVESVGRDKPLSSVSASDLKKYLIDRYYKHDDVRTWVTYNNVLGNIKTFFAWCADPEQSLLDENPVKVMKKIQIPYRQPQYLKAEDTKRIFKVLWDWRHDRKKSVDLAYSILFFFCGMRLSEIERVRLGPTAIKINLAEKFIRVELPKGVSKGIRPRTFAIPEQALAWMEAFDFMKAIAQSNGGYRRHLLTAAYDAGVKLPKNAGRHTFITMFEAVYHDANALTAIVGNTDDVRAKNYNGVELASEGRAYFSILPPTD